MAYYCRQECILCSSTPVNMLFTKKWQKSRFFSFISESFLMFAL